MKLPERLFASGIFLWFMFILAMNIGIVYVIIHFVRKYW